METEASLPTPLRPLAGLKVVDLGVWHAGPGAGAILGDLGADVVKVETLAGDPERHFGDFGVLAGKSPIQRADWNVLFEMSNRNKRSIAIDIGTESGRGVLGRLVKTADVFLTNIRRPTKEKLGIDYASLRRTNPDLVYVSVSAFGPDGPMADLGGFDTLGQAVAGMLFVTGADEPQVLQVTLLDQLTAIAASHAALTALVARQLHGGGCEVHASLVGSAVWLQHGNFLASSVATSPLNLSWDRNAADPLRNTFKCSDGRWIVGTNHPPANFWRSLCVAMNREDLLHDERFDTPEKRKVANAQLIAEFDLEFARRTRDEWLAHMPGHGLLFAPVNTIEEALSDPQLLANAYIREFDHRYLGRIRVPGSPLIFDRYEAGMTAAAPEIGEHTGQILRESGYSPTEIDELVRAKAVRGTTETETRED